MGLSLQQSFNCNHAWKVEEEAHEASQAQAPQDEAAQQVGVKLACSRTLSGIGSLV